MIESVLWVGGWASGLACWRKDLERLYPAKEHSFLDVHALISEPGLLSLAASALPANGTLVAWSMGSLMLHRALADKSLKTECRFVSVCPIFDFTREGSPVPPAALARMARKLPRSRPEVIEEFWGMVLGNSRVTQDQEDAWLRQAQAYSSETLGQGLEILGNLRVDKAKLPALPGRHRFLASFQDPLAPPTRDTFLGGDWIGFARGHLPFLDYPELMGPLIEGRLPHAVPA